MFAVSKISFIVELPLRPSRAGPHTHRTCVSMKVDFDGHDSWMTTPVAHCLM